MKQSIWIDEAVLRDHYDRIGPALAQVGIGFAAFSQAVQALADRFGRHAVPTWEGLERQMVVAGARTESVGLKRWRGLRRHRRRYGRGRRG